MFKTDNYIIIFVIVFASFFLPLAFYVEQISTANDESLKVEQALINACESALYTANIYDEEVFSDPIKRENAYRAFYDNYSDSFNYFSTASKEGAKYHVPVIFMVDWDGYYIVTTQAYHPGQGTFYADDISLKNTWSKQYGNFLVQFRLNNDVDVYNTYASSGATTHYTGNYRDVYNQIRNDVGPVSELAFLTNYGDFSNERTTCIVQEMNKQVQYFVNTKNVFFNRMDTTYQIVMPTNKGDKNADVLDQPCVISFLQGSQNRTMHGYTNIFAYAAADYITQKHYYLQELDGTLYYHTSDCSDLTNRKNMSSMHDCAARGAVPHSCVLGN